jgi:hypothetical protein
MLPFDASYSSQIRIRTNPHSPTRTHIFFPFSPADDEQLQRARAQATVTLTMSFNSQTTSDPSSGAIPSPAPPIGIFELNQARRAKVTRELEALRSGTSSLCPEPLLLDFTKRLPSCSFPTGFLERPTVEGLEAFAEKKIEYGEMMDDHAADLEAVIQRQLAVFEGLERKAKIAEERRVKEFQCALEHMSPAEAEAARRAERERPFHIQRRIAARAAAFDAECSREIARIRAKYPCDN